MIGVSAPDPTKRVERPWRVFSKRLTEETTETREKKKGKRERKTKDKKSNIVYQLESGDRKILTTNCRRL